MNTYRTSCNPCESVYIRVQLFFERSKEVAAGSEITG